MAENGAGNEDRNQDHQCYNQKDWESFRQEKYHVLQELAKPVKSVFKSGGQTLSKGYIPVLDLLGFCFLCQADLNGGKADLSVCAVERGLIGVNSVLCFSYFIFNYLLRPFLSLFSYWDPYNVNVGAFDIISEIP